MFLENMISMVKTRLLPWISNSLNLAITNWSFRRCQTHFISDELRRANCKIKKKTDTPNSPRPTLGGQSILEGLLLMDQSNPHKVNCCWVALDLKYQFCYSWYIYGKVEGASLWILFLGFFGLDTSRGTIFTRTPLCFLTQYHSFVIRQNQTTF